MTRLHDIQSALLHDIYSGERTSLRYLDARYATAQRLDIYQNNTVLGLSDLLADIFPVTAQLAGEEFFKTIARFYIRQHAMAEGNRHGYGQQLPAFLRSFKHTAEMPFLADVAALEAARFAAATADDAPALDFTLLGQALMHNEEYILAPHPSVALVNVQCNALDIWLEHQKETIDAITLLNDAQTIMVWRDAANLVCMRVVSPGFAVLLQQCLNAAPFVAAMGAASETETDTALLQQEFAEALQNGIFTQTPEEESQPC